MIDDARVVIDIWLLGLLVAALLAGAAVYVAGTRDWNDRRCLFAGAASGVVLLSIMFGTASFM
jgi:hypothetical protein